MKKIRISLSEEDYDIFKTLSDNSEDVDRGDIRKTMVIMAKCGYYALCQQMIDEGTIIHRSTLFNKKCFFCGQKTESESLFIKGNTFWICDSCFSEIIKSLSDNQ